MSRERKSTLHNSIGDFIVSIVVQLVMLYMVESNGGPGWAALGFAFLAGVLMLIYLKEDHHDSP